MDTVPDLRSQAQFPCVCGAQVARRRYGATGTTCEGRQRRGGPPRVSDERRWGSYAEPSSRGPATPRTGAGPHGEAWWGVPKKRPGLVDRRVGGWHVARLFRQGIDHGRRSEDISERRDEVAQTSRLCVAKVEDLKVQGGRAVGGGRNSLHDVADERVVPP